MAMPPPNTPVTEIGSSLVNHAIQLSRQSPRRRIICPFHKSESEKLHRMLNAIQPFCYIQPHRHSNPPKAESIIVLKGSVCYVTFDESGSVKQMLRMRANTDCFGVDIEPGVFHTFFALEEDTVLFEVKPGPYERSADKDFAAWAPKEGTAEARSYLEGLYRICDEKAIQLNRR